MAKARTSLKRKDSEQHKSQKPAKSHKSGYIQPVKFDENEPRFTYDEVKEMIERLLSQQTRASPAASAGIKKVKFEDIVVGEHSVHGCKAIIEQMVQATRRVRTLQEVLADIKDNLNKRVYTEIIHRATLKGDLPKKPPSAYLLYHQDRYNELRTENSLAVEVSKIVAEEWKTLPDMVRREYQLKHEAMVKNYDEEMDRLGLIDAAAPKRPKPPKSLYVDDALSGYNTQNWSKETMAAERERLGQTYDNLPPNEKQRWVDLNKKQMKQFFKKREDYVASHPHLNHALPEKKTRVNEKAKLPEAPKSAVKYFMLKKLPEGLSGTELEEAKKKLKEKFHHLREKKLLKYIKKAVQDKERYDKEVDEFKRSFPGKAIPKTKPSITKEQLKLYAKVVENRPALPAPTAYLHYCGKMLTDMNDNDDEQAPTARMQTASQSWKESKDKDKRNAEKEHMADIERYIAQMEAWLEGRSEERKMQVLSEEPKANPDYWKKKLNRMKKNELKRKEQKAAAAAAYSPNKYLKPSPNSKQIVSPTKSPYYSSPMRTSYHYAQDPNDIPTYFTSYRTN